MKPGPIENTLKAEHGVRLSALASEIATDMRREEFADGLTVRTLTEWLGEPPGLIKDALRELLEQRVAYRVKNSFYPLNDHPRVPDTVKHRPEIERRLLMSQPYTQIATDLGTSIGVVKIVARGRAKTTKRAWRGGPI